jgi:hypothetical protein
MSRGEGGVTELAVDNRGVREGFLEEVSTVLGSRDLPGRGAHKDGAATGTKAWGQGGLQVAEPGELWNPWPSHLHVRRWCSLELRMSPALLGASEFGLLSTSVTDRVSPQ